MHIPEAVYLETERLGGFILCRGAAIPLAPEDRRRSLRETEVSPGKGIHEWEQPVNLVEGVRRGLRSFQPGKRHLRNL